MSKKSWKRAWRDELDAHLSPLRDEIVREPIPAAPTEHAPERPRFRRPVIFGTLGSVGAVACILVICIVSGLFASPTPDPSGFVAAAVSLEINPTVTLVTDEEGRVTRVIAGNADADILLATEERLCALVGVPLAHAVRTLADYAARAGYLDLSSPDAVRLCGTGDCKDEWLASAQTSLEEYFQEQSIPSVVICERISLSDFSSRVGASVMESVEALLSWTQEESALFAEREARELSEDALSQIYRDRFVNSTLKDTLVERVQAYVGDLLHIYDLNVSVLATALCDYWTAIEEGIPFYAPDPELAERLVLEMQEALRSFEDAYGVRMESREQLAEQSSTLSTLLSDFLAAWASGVTDAITTLRESGLILEQELEDLLVSTPTDGTSYLSASKRAAEISLSHRESVNAERYGAERESVDFDGLRKELCERYGSLEAFFEAREK